ncbi:MAG TPA: NADH:ubiquinone oxidoreductase [Methanomicrobia archaeon]|nr:NADH:ubiquinone oxidoreductase [Methanomicrobia archaeon]HEX59849.1 NADH:ubiquinone oxidoreductase [Methanomicrobia archaeon]
MPRFATVPIGPYHPALKEPELFKLKVEGETVVDVDIRIGYNHRGIEKLSESMTYHQITFLVERICGICSNIHPLCYVQAAEAIAGIEPPERALYIRTIIEELERIHSHLLWLGIGAHIIGFDTLFMWVWKIREPVLDIFEAVCGNRQTYAMMKIGGVRRDIKEEHTQMILKIMDETERATRSVINMVLEDPVARARLEGVGVLTKEDARKYCTVGPTARGSGLNIDARKDHPHAAYDLVDFKVPVMTEGDVLAKTVVRLEEILESISIIKQALDAMPSGDIATEFKEMPPGEGVGMAEAPRGEDIHYLKSNGTNMPERHKIRAPSYMNIPSLKPQLMNYEIADAPIIIASIDPCFSCTDRITVVDARDGKSKTLSWDELVYLSRRKTRRLK